MNNSYDGKKSANFFKFAAGEINAYDKILLKFNGIYDKILRDDNIVSNGDKLYELGGELKEYCKNLRKNSKDGKLHDDVIDLAILKINANLRVSNRLLTEIESYYEKNGKSDKEKIANAQKNGDEIYALFNNQWKKDVDVAIKNKRWGAVLGIFSMLPAWENFVNVYENGDPKSFKGANKLSEIYTEIIVWQEEVKTKIPQEYVLSYRLDSTEKLLIKNDKRLSKLAQDLSAATEVTNEKNVKNIYLKKDKSKNSNKINNIIERINTLMEERDSNISLLAYLSQELNNIDDNKYSKEI